jgi:hypothetical protein
MMKIVLATALVASALAAADPCATGTPVVVDGKTYGTKVLIVTPSPLAGPAVEKPNTKVAAMVVGALTESEGGSTFCECSNIHALAGQVIASLCSGKSDGDFDYVYGQQPRGLIVGFDVR